MPKHDFMSPKAIGNRIKAKGLQKLRWYCQMCEKQCRDENGFKCHCESESHQRQMLLFAGNSGKYIDGFSEKFEAHFMEILSRQYRSTRVWCNTVYQGMVADGEHIHMNSTKWESLSEFVMYLGTEGKVTVDEGMTASGKPGFFLRYVDTDPLAVAHAAKAAKKQKTEMNEEDRHQRDMQQQMERARALAAASGDAGPTVATELGERSADEKVAFGMGTAKQKEKAKPAASRANALSGGGKGGGASGSSGGGGGGKRKLSAMEQIRQEEQAKKQRQKELERAAAAAAPPITMDYWLKAGITVKVMHKKIAGGKYYKKKGRVLRVHERYVGEISMNDSGDVLKLDQQNLETVLPKPGGSVMVLQGSHRGKSGVLSAMHHDDFAASVEIKGEPGTQRYPYEEICKLA